jgi:hypothetical protein
MLRVLLLGFSGNRVSIFPTDGELYFFGIHHPDTNGIMDYFVRRLGGVRCDIGRGDTAVFESVPRCDFVVVRREG